VNAFGNGTCGGKRTLPPGCRFLGFSVHLPNNRFGDEELLASGLAAVEVPDAIMVFLENRRCT